MLVCLIMSTRDEQVYTFGVRHQKEAPKRGTKKVAQKGTKKGTEKALIL
jgi:hypothetical protein